MKYEAWKNEVIEEYNEYLEMQKLIKQNREECDEEFEEEVITAPKKSSEEIQMMNIKAIDDWLQLGGLINSDNDANGNYILFVEGSEEIYYDWINEEKLEDTVENEKRFCRNALEQANVPDEVIEELMEGW